MKGATKCADGTFSVRLLLGGKQRVIRSGISDEAYASKFYDYARWYFAAHMKVGNPVEPESKPGIFDVWCLEAEERLRIKGVIKDVSQKVDTSAQVPTDTHSLQAVEQHVRILFNMLGDRTAQIDLLEKRVAALEARAPALPQPDKGIVYGLNPHPIRVEDSGKVELTELYRGKGPTITVRHEEAAAKLLRLQDPDAGRFQDSPKPQPEDSGGFDLA
jgi:hypothetical protein